MTVPLQCFRDHVYEPVTPAASTDRISLPGKQTSRDESRLVIRIPLTEELVMADDTGSEPDDERRRSGEEDDVDDEEEDEEDDEDDEEDDNDDGKKQRQVTTTDESIYEGENENSSVGEAIDASNGGTTRIKLFQQKVKVKADTLRAKLQGVTKRKPKQKIVVDGENGEKGRRKFGQFATLPKKFTFNAPKVNFSHAFNRNTSRNSAAADADQSGGSTADETKSGRFSLPRFGFSKTSSESPKPSKSGRMGASRLSIPSFRSRTWSDASKVSKPGSPKTRFMDFGTYPRIFSKQRGKASESANKSKTPPPPQPSATMTYKAGDSPEPQGKSMKNSFRRRFFRSHKESTPAPTDEQTATLAVEEELDESHVSKESLAEFGDSDLQEVISLSDDCRSKDGAKSVSDHCRAAGVIEEIDSDEFFLREKGLSRGDVHISNYLSSEIRDVFRSNRTRSVEGDDNDDSNDNRGTGTSKPARPSRTNSLRRPGRTPNATGNAPADRFSTMPKSFGGTRPKPEYDAPPENIITSQTFEPSVAGGATLPSTFRAPWRTAHRDNVVAHMPPKPPIRQRMSKFSTFDTRSMIDLSRKRSQSQSVSIQHIYIILSVLQINININIINAIERFGCFVTVSRQNYFAQM